MCHFLLFLIFMTWTSTTTTAYEEKVYIDTVVKKVKSIIMESLKRCKHPDYIIDTTMKKITTIYDFKRYIFDDTNLVNCLTYWDYKSIGLSQQDIFMELIGIKKV
jgi:hypothetical protein